MDEGAFQESLLKNLSIFTKITVYLIYRLISFYLEFYPEDPGVSTTSANLYSLALKPGSQHPFRKARVSKALVEAAEDLVRDNPDHNAVHTETRQDNYVVIGMLSRHFGYEVFGRYKGFYSDGEDAVRLCKDVADFTP